MTLPRASPGYPATNRGQRYAPAGSDGRAVRYLVATPCANSRRDARHPVNLAIEACGPRASAETRNALQPARERRPIGARILQIWRAVTGDE